MKAHDLTGRVFGRLTVLSVDRSGRHGKVYRCRCRCGELVSRSSSALLAGDSQSCGCLRRETTAAQGRANASHGKRSTSEYRVWAAMRNRCTNPKNPNYLAYGGRGISVCAAWDSFEQFFADMGPRPPGTTIDRENNDGNYEPGNCRWATAEQQAGNRRISRKVTYQGETHSVAEWARRCGLGKQTLLARLNAGWDIARALNQEVRDH